MSKRSKAKLAKIGDQARQQAHIRKLETAVKEWKERCEAIRHETLAKMDDTKASLEQLTQSLIDSRKRYESACGDAALQGILALGSDNNKAMCYALNAGEYHGRAKTYHEIREQIQQIRNRLHDNIIDHDKWRTSSSCHDHP